MLQAFRWLLFLLLLAVLPAAWRALHPAPELLPSPAGARLEWVDCWFESPLLRPLHCGHFFPAAGPGEPVHRLPLVYLPAPIWAQGQGPVLFLSGGPGSGSWLDADGMAGWYNWLEDMDWPHDLVLFDPRGTGLSRPRLDCPETLAFYRQALGVGYPVEEGARLGAAAARACYRRLRAAEHDLRAFGTPGNAADAAELMALIGGSDWNLYGASYGTRVALELMRQAPERIRSVILDSVYPPQIDGDLTQPGLLDQALRRLLDDCRADPDCAAEYPGLPLDLGEILARLQEDPLELGVQDPAGPGTLAVRMNGERLAWVIYDALFWWENYPLLLELMQDLAAGRVPPQLESLMQGHLEMLFDPGFSDAVYFSAHCHDRGPLELDAYRRELARFPLVAPLFPADLEHDVCNFWDSGDAGDGFRQPVRSDLPTLVLAGEYDPTTPPDWAGAPLAGLTSAYVYLAPGVGHSLLDSDECSVDLARAFLADPSSAARVDCLAGQ